MTDANPKLTNEQLEILNVLWNLGEANVNDVREVLAEAGRDLAYTTVSTMLTKLERKGVVTHAAQGRTFVYRPAVPREQVARSLTRELLEGVFGGSPSDMVGHLLEASEVAPDELERIKQLIRRKERERGKRE